MTTSKNPLIIDFKSLITFQLSLIGRCAANIMLVDEQQRFMGQSLLENFKLSVYCLDDFLFPLWDQKYQDARELVYSNPHKLLQVAMDLIKRQKILLHIKDIDVYDTEPDIPEEVVTL